MLRNIEVAENGPHLIQLLGIDLERGARLLDTGMWSLSVVIGGSLMGGGLRRCR